MKLAGERIEHLEPWLIKTDPTGNISKCCLADYGFSTTNILPTIAPFDLLTTSTIQIRTGKTLSEAFLTNITALCTADAASANANAFTLNGDQINDFFLPPLHLSPGDPPFWVFNRWGKKVFKTSDAGTLGWDGNTDGQSAPADIYGWLLEYDTFIEGQLETKQEKGEITLLR